MNSISPVTMMPPTGASVAVNQEAAIRAVKAQTEALNAAIARAVDAGLIIEVGRASRYHSDQAAWGDQIAPMVQPRG